MIRLGDQNLQYKIQVPLRLVRMRLDGVRGYLTSLLVGENSLSRPLSVSSPPFNVLSVLSASDSISLGDAGDIGGEPPGTKSVSSPAVSPSVVVSIGRVVSSSMDSPLDFLSTTRLYSSISASDTLSNGSH